MRWLWSTRSEKWKLKWRKIDRVEMKFDNWLEGLAKSVMKTLYGDTCIHLKATWPTLDKGFCPCSPRSWLLSLSLFFRAWPLWRRVVWKWQIDKGDNVLTNYESTLFYFILFWAVSKVNSATRQPQVVCARLEKNGKNTLWRWSPSESAVRWHISWISPREKASTVRCWISYQLPPLPATGGNYTVH